VISRAKVAVCLSATVKDACFNNIQVTANGVTAVGTMQGGEFENLLFDGIFVTNRCHVKPTGTICNLYNSRGKNIMMKNVFAEKIVSPARLTGDIHITFSDLVVSDTAGQP
jgi:hypothetical protein